MSLLQSCKLICLCLEAVLFLKQVLLLLANQEYLLLKFGFERCCFTFAVLEFCHEGLILFLRLCLIVLHYLLKVLVRHELLSHFTFKLLETLRLQIDLALEILFMKRLTLHDLLKLMLSSPQPITEVPDLNIGLPVLSGDALVHLLSFDILFKENIILLLQIIELLR